MKRLIVTLSRAAACTALLLLLFGPAAAPAAESFETVKCKGHGYIFFQGDGEISIVGEGVLIVNENSDITSFSYEGDQGTDIAVTQPKCTPADDGNCIYIDINGKTQVAGDNLEISFAGADIGINASGNAKLVLKGYGIYRMGLLIDRWALEGSTLLLGNFSE